MAREWWAYFLWIPAAAVLGVAVTAGLSGWLRLPRGWVVLVWTVVAVPFLYGYWRWSGLDWQQQLARRWPWGLVVAVIVGAFVVKNVLSQPASATPGGLGLLFDVAWLSLVYGTVDALMLSVLPVCAAWQGLSRVGWTDAWTGRIAAGAVALIASLMVTAAYHWGYLEFRGPSIAAPVFGNGILSLGYLISTNPLAAWVSHVAMHVASVFHGLETTVQLPPHY